MSRDKKGPSRSLGRLYYLTPRDLSRLPGALKGKSFHLTSRFTLVDVNSLDNVLALFVLSDSPIFFLKDLCKSESRGADKS